MIASATEIQEGVPAAPRTRRARRSTKIRWPGLVFILTSLFLAIGAFNGQNNLLFFTFGLSVLAILLSGVISGSSMLGISITRVAPRSLPVGGSALLQYQVMNKNRILPAFGVLIEEIIEHDRTESTGLVEVRPALVIGLRAGETGRVRASIEGERSGVIRLRGYRIRSSMPFGLLEKRIDFECPAVIEIHPAILPIRQLHTKPTGSARATQPDPNSSMRGQDEFLGVREYIPGDPLRSVAWARSATHHSLVVKTYSAPRSEKCWITVEAASLSQSDLEWVLCAAASLAADRIRLGLAVGLEIPEWGVLLAPKSGRGQLTRMLSALSRRGSRGESESQAPRIGERWSVQAGPGEAGGAHAVIDALRQDSWAGPRAELPVSMLEAGPESHRLGRALERLRVFAGGTPA